MSASSSAATPIVAARALLADLARVMGVYAPARFRGIAVESLCTDSRAALPGSLFFAVPGAKDDGARFAGDAVTRGARAIVVARGAQLPAEIAARVAVLEVESVRRAKALAAHAFHDHPSTALTCVGVTGTKGKTTTAMLVHSILEAAALRPSLIGTIEERIFGQPARPSLQTTPDPLHLADLLAQARAAGGQSAVMEVSSHALDQERTTGLLFRAAAFTQLAREHLDYHPSVDHYRDSKARLFETLEEDAVAAVNAEDVHSLELVARSRARLITYGAVPGAHVEGELLAADVTGSRFRVRLDRTLGGGELEAVVALPGRHNWMNALAAIAVALGLELPREVIVRGLAELRHVPGRLEAVNGGQPFAVLVDYAHTDDALEKILRLLRPLTRGKLITVFGCGGDRDRTKRPRMGNVAASFSDRVIITSDNPRTEEPQQILADIVAGVPTDASVAAVQVEPDRRRAIERALADAREGDVVLLAGKGHETYQIIGAERLDFDDRQVAREFLCRRCS